MTQGEYSDAVNKTNQFYQWTERLHKMQLVVEDLKYPEGTCRLDIGGGRSTFQTINVNDVMEGERLRETLLQFFRSEVNKLKSAMAEL